MRFAVILFVLFVVACIAPAASQSTVPYKNLVFEGGGIRGIAYAGSVDALDKAGVLAQITRVCGTSVGAMVASLLAVGYSSEEILNIVPDLKIKQYADGRFGFLGGIPRLISHYGWYRGKKIKTLVGDLLEAKTKNAALTFSELHQLVLKDKNFRDLYIPATNLTLQRIEILSYETYPEMEIRDAVRISLSIPLFFKAIFITVDGKIAKQNQPNSCLMLDGGIIGNFPIQVFDDKKYVADINFLDTVINGNQILLKNRQTLGVRLDTEEQILYDRDSRGLAPKNITDFNDYMEALYVIVIENLNRQQLTKEDWERTISVNTLEIGPRIRKLSEKEKNALVESGRKGVMTFFARVPAH